MLRKLILAFIVFIVVLASAADQRIHSNYKRGLFRDLFGDADTARIVMDSTKVILVKQDSLCFYDPALGDTVCLYEFALYDSVNQLISDSLGSLVDPDTLWSIDPDTVQKVINLSWKNDNGSSVSYASNKYDLIKWNYRTGVWIETTSSHDPDSLIVTVGIDTNRIVTQDTLRQNYLPNETFLDSLSNYGIYDSIGVTKGAIAKTLTATGCDDKLMFQLGYGLLHYNILADDTLGIEIDSTKFATVKALEDSIDVVKTAYTDSAIQMINFFVGYTDNGILDYDNTDEWYFTTSIGDEIDEFIQTPDRSDGTEYSDDVVFRVQIPDNYVAQDTVRIVIRGFTYVVLPSITRNAILTRVHKENQDGRGVSNIAYTDSVVFSTGSNYTDNANYEIKVNGSGIAAGDVLKVHLRSKLDATGAAVYQVLYNAWMYYRKRNY